MPGVPQPRRFRTGAVFRRGTWACCVLTPPAREVSWRRDVRGSEWHFGQNCGCPQYREFYARVLNKTCTRWPRRPSYGSYAETM